MNQIKQTIRYERYEGINENYVNEIINNELTPKVARIVKSNPIPIHYDYRDDILYIFTVCSYKHNAICKDYIQKTRSILDKLSCIYRRYEKKLKIKILNIEIPEALNNYYVKSDICSFFYKEWLMLPNDLIRIILEYHYDFEVYYKISTFHNKYNELCLSLYINIIKNSFSVTLLYNKEIMDLPNYNSPIFDFKIKEINGNLLGKIMKGKFKVTSKCILGKENFLHMISDIKNMKTSYTQQNYYYIIDGRALNDNLQLQEINNKLHEWSYEKKNRFQYMLQYGRRDIYYIITRNYNNEFAIAQVEIDRLPEIIKELNEISMIIKYLQRQIPYCSQLASLMRWRGGSGGWGRVLGVIF